MFLQDWLRPGSIVQLASCRRNRLSNLEVLGFWSSGHSKASSPRFTTVATTGAPPRFRDAPLRGVTRKARDPRRSNRGVDEDSEPWSKATEVFSGVQEI